MLRAANYIVAVIAELMHTALEAALSRVLRRLTGHIELYQTKYYIGYFMIQDLSTML